MKVLILHLGKAQFSLLLSIKIILAGFAFRYIHRLKVMIDVELDDSDIENYQGSSGWVCTNIKIRSNTKLVEREGPSTQIQLQRRCLVVRTTINIKYINICT